MDAVIRLYGNQIRCVCIECNRAGTREDLCRRRNHRCHSSFDRVCTSVCLCVYYVLSFVHSSVTSYFNQNVQLQYASLLRRMATTRSMNLCLFFYSSFCTLPLYRIALNWLGLLHWTWNLCHFGFIPNSFSSFPWNNKVMQHCISLFWSSNSAFARQHISHNMRLVMSVFVVVCVIFFYFFLDHALPVFSGAIVSVVL